MKRMTKKQKALVRATVLDPHSSFTERAAAAGYNHKQHAHRAMKSDGVVDAMARVKDLMEQREKLSLGALLTHLEEGLEATEVRALKVEGTKFKVSTEVKDFNVRHKFLNSALELHGALKPKDSAPSGPLNIAVILLGGGSEAEKAAVADALLAARISRGLHPIENRPLTPAEIETYRSPK